MKTKNIHMCATSVFSVATLITLMTAPALMAQTVIVRPPSISIQVPAPPPPAVVIAPPVVDVVPDYYVWDGAEYVGVVGDTCVYLGPHHVWLAMPAARLAFFHDWEKGHHDWRDHAIENERYRLDGHGHEHPWKGHDHDADHHDADHHDSGHHDHDGH
jgi:hypothetical protein